MVQEKVRANDDAPLQAAIQAVDLDALLDGEDPTSMLVDDAQHWIEVYQELIQYKESLLGTAEEEVADLEHPESKGEAIEVDRVILATELERFRRRLAFWRERLDELQGAQPS